MAGFLASVITQPADVVKTRMQINPYRYSSNTNALLCVIKVRIAGILCPCYTKKFQ